MKMPFLILLAGLCVGATAAQAQSTSLEPSVPNPANPYPLNPVATDGTPLVGRYNGVNVYSGRSAYVAPGYRAGVAGAGIGFAPLDAGYGIVGGAIDGGLGLAGGAIGAGTGFANDVVR